MTGPTTDPPPRPEPDLEASDPHTPDIEQDDDARWLDPVDPRRRRIEQLRGRPFGDDD
jgi:hypothetical protein